MEKVPTIRTATENPDAFVELIDLVNLMERADLETFDQALNSLETYIRENESHSKLAQTLQFAFRWIVPMDFAAAGAIASLLSDKKDISLWRIDALRNQTRKALTQKTIE